jgi:hypothetical protein
MASDSVRTVLRASLSPQQAPSAATAAAAASNRQALIALLALLASSPAQMASVHPALPERSPLTPVRAIVSVVALALALLGGQRVSLVPLVSGLTAMGSVKRVPVARSRLHLARPDAKPAHVATRHRHRQSVDHVALGRSILDKVAPVWRAPQANMRQLARALVLAVALAISRMEQETAVTPARQELPRLTLEASAKLVLQASSALLLAP